MKNNFKVNSTLKYKLNIRFSYMACIQNSKKHIQCANLASNDLEYPNFCKYHVNRFKDGKDTPNPIIIAGLNIEAVDLPGLPEAQLPPIMQNLPRLNAMPIPFDFDQRQFEEDIREELNDLTIDHRINLYIHNNREEIIRQILPNFPIQQKDDILIEMVMNLEDETEKGFLIANYERLFDLVHNLVMPVPQRMNVQGDPPAGLINMVLAALGFQQGPAREGLQQAAAGVAVQDRIPGPRNLREFVQDNQNIHTKELVDPVIANAKMMIKLSKKKCPEQDTFKEIVYECKLSDDARKQFCFMYYSDEKIYNLKAPTYRLVLDGIWHYVLKQKEDTKKDILMRMSQELEDNIGMCSQGNLSRIINILSGFMDGIGQTYKESIQDKMAKISKIEDKDIRLKKAKDVLKKDKIPDDQWSAWLDALE